MVRTIVPALKVSLATDVHAQISMSVQVMRMTVTQMQRAQISWARLNVLANLDSREMVQRALTSTSASWVLTIAACMHVAKIL